MRITPRQHIQAAKKPKKAHGDKKVMAYGKKLMDMGKKIMMYGKKK